MVSRNSKLLPYAMWALPVLFFSYQMVLRVWPGLMMVPIMAQLKIEADEFGIISSAYYWGYAWMQIPVAILLDKWGPRWVISGLAVLCGMGFLLFTYTASWKVALVGRFLVGAGSAVGFLGVSKVLSQWFPKKDYAKMVGISVAIGLLGALGSGNIKGMVNIMPEKVVAYSLSLFAIILGVAIWFVLRVPVPSGNQEVSNSFQFSNLKEVLSSPVILLLGLVNLLMVGPLEGFVDVWGLPYLKKAYGIDETIAYGLAYKVFLGVVLAGPIIPILGKKLGNYTVINICGLGITLSFAGLLSGSIGYHYYGFTALFLAVGFFSGYQINILAAGEAFVNSASVGITIAFLNSMNMLGGGFFHAIIGKIINALWMGELTQDGVRVYPLSAYQTALSVIPITSFIGVLLITAVVLKWGNLLKEGNASKPPM